MPNRTSLGNNEIDTVALTNYSLGQNFVGIHLRMEEYVILPMNLFSLLI
jgi:hypothetical protein